MEEIIQNLNDAIESINKALVIAMREYNQSLSENLEDSYSVEEEDFESPRDWLTIMNETGKLLQDIYETRDYIEDITAEDDIV